MIAVVPDTTVLVSAAISNRGNSYRILRAWQDAEVTLIVCHQLLDELRDVLLRDRLRRFISREDALAFVELLSVAADVRPDPTPIAGLVPQDPEDDFLIALAREAGADYVLSGDQHLTALRSARPPIITAAQLVAKLERRRS